jgi:hypothetical protein
MNFAFSEEQKMLRRSVAEFLAAECPPAFVRKMMEHETAHSDDLWKKVAGRPGDPAAIRRQRRLAPRPRHRARRGG